MFQKFIWNSDVSLNLPGDAEQGAGVPARVWPGHAGGLKHQSDPVRPEAFGSCDVNTAGTVWFCVFFTVQNSKKLQRSSCSECGFKKKVLTVLTNPHLLLTLWFLLISKTLFFSRKWVQIEISSGSCFFLLLLFFLQTTEIHPLTKKGQRLASGREGTLWCVDLWPEAAVRTVPLEKKHNYHHCRLAQDPFVDSCFASYITFSPTCAFFYTDVFLFFKPAVSLGWRSVNTGRKYVYFKKKTEGNSV